MNESTIRKMVNQVIREIDETTLEEDSLVSNETLEEKEEETIDETDSPEETHNDRKPNSQQK